MEYLILQEVNAWLLYPLRTTYVKSKLSCDKRFSFYNSSIATKENKIKILQGILGNLSNGMSL